MSSTAGTVVDSSVLLDVFTEDPNWIDWSRAQLIEAAQRGAIVLNAVVLAEIARRFPDIEILRSALPSMAVVEEIPLAARIIAACDTYDAIVTDRPYRPGRTPGEALAELERIAGTQLDERAVAALGQELAEA